VPSPSLTWGELTVWFFERPFAILYDRFILVWPDEIWWLFRRNFGFCRDFLRSGGVGITPAFLEYLNTAKRGFLFHEPLASLALIGVAGVWLRFHLGRRILFFLGLFLPFSAFYYAIYMCAQDCIFRWPVYYGAPPLAIAALIFIPFNQAVLTSKSRIWL